MCTLLVLIAVREQKSVCMVLSMCILLLTYLSYKGTKKLIHGILIVYATGLVAVREKSVCMVLSMCILLLTYLLLQGNKKVDVWYSKCVHYLFCCSTGTKKCMYGIINVYTTFDVPVVTREQKSVWMVLSMCILLLTHMLQ